MEINKNDAYYKAGFKEGETHSEPSEITRKLIKNMEDKFDNLKDKVSCIEKNVIKEVSEMKIEIITEIVAIKDDIKKDCEDRYAKKWVADAMKLVMATVTVTIIGAILVLILK